MKKRIFAAMLAFSVLGSINVFAEETEQPLLISAQQKTEEQDMAFKSQYTTMSGTVKSIEQKQPDSQNEEVTYSILALTDDADDTVFVTDANAFIVNSKDGSFMTFDEINPDMKITAIIAKNAPMTMSLPPITNPIGYVVGEENFVTTGYFDGEWTSHDTQPMLQLNVSEETKIVDMQGSKKVFTADDVKEQDCMVIYGATTRSIPAQTTPVFVLLLEGTEIAEEPILVPTEEVLVPEEKEETGKTAEPVEATQPEILLEKPEPKPVELVPLREFAENKGFTVTWTANDKPVLLQKDEVTIEITLGKAEYKKGNEILKSEKTAELKDSKIYAGSDVIE